VVASAAPTKLSYIGLLLDREQEKQPYLAGGMLLHHIAWALSLQVLPTIQSQPKNLTQLRAAVALAFRIVRAMACLLKVSATYSRRRVAIAPDGTGGCQSSRRS
jgi:hypothetical protein